MALTENQQTPKGTLLQRILIEGREHWSQPGYDPDCALRFLRAVQCKTAELGRRVYASESEVAVFCNTCKSPACTGCGHWSTIQWQRERWCALPEGPYRVITLTMPNTLWPLFSSNPRLCRKLAEIAARVIVGYARVRRGVEVGVVPILHTFNGKLEFNSHVHALVTGRDLRRESGACIFFDRDQLMRSWKRLVIALLRAALQAACLKSQISHDEIEGLLQHEEIRHWKVHVQAFDGKEHFLRYAGRYVRRPPIAERRIMSVSNGLARFWYKDKRLGRRQTVTLTIEEFIDRWAQHIPKHYRHSMRYFGLFGPRRWNRVVETAFLLVQEKRRRPPKRLRWAISVQRLSGRDPLLDSRRVRMTFVRHLPPVFA
jgi:hypothetical protein